MKELWLDEEYVVQVLSPSQAQHLLYYDLHLYHLNHHFAPAYSPPPSPPSPHYSSFTSSPPPSPSSPSPRCSSSRPPLHNPPPHPISRHLTRSLHNMVKPLNPMKQSSSGAKVEESELPFAWVQLVFKPFSAAVCAYQLLKLPEHWHQNYHTIYMI